MVEGSVQNRHGFESMNNSASSSISSQKTNGTAFDVDMERQAKDNTVALAVGEDSNKHYPWMLRWLRRRIFDRVRIAQRHLFCSMTQAALLTSMYGV